MRPIISPFGRHHPGRRALRASFAAAWAAAALLAQAAGDADATPTARADRRSVPPVRCQRISWDQVAGMFQLWSEAVSSGSGGDIAALYAPDAVLLPTLAPAPRLGRDSIGSYYSTLSRRMERIRTIKRTIKLRCNIALDTGVLAFNLAAANGGAGQTTAARYTLVYEYVGGHWLIVHDHSSVMAGEFEDARGRDNDSGALPAVPATLANPAAAVAPAPQDAPAPQRVVPVDVVSHDLPSTVPAEAPLPPAGRANP